MSHVRTQIYCRQGKPGVPRCSIDDGFANRKPTSACSLTTAGCSHEQTSRANIVHASRRVEKASNLGCSPRFLTAITLAADLQSQPGAIRPMSRLRSAQTSQIFRRVRLSDGGAITGAEERDRAAA